jgi:hypothetical protein
MTDDDTARDTAEGAKPEPSATVTPVAPVSQQVPPVVVSPSLGADTNASVPGGQPTQPAAEAPRETPQQQA